MVFKPQKSPSQIQIFMICSVVYIVVMSTRQYLVEVAEDNLFAILVFLLLFCPVRPDLVFPLIPLLFVQTHFRFIITSWQAIKSIWELGKHCLLLALSWTFTTHHFLFNRQMIIVISFIPNCVKSFWMTKPSVDWDVACQSMLKSRLFIHT